MKIGLRLKLMLMTILVCLFSSAIFGILVYYQMRTHTLNDKQSVMQTNVSLITIKVDKYADSALSAAETIASQGSNFTADPAQARELTEKLKDMWNASTVAWVGRDGKSTINSGGQALDLSGRTYVQQALRGRSSLSGALVSLDTGTAVIAAASPVYDEDNRIIGAIVVALDLDEGLEDILSQHTYETDDTYLINSEGRMLTRSRLATGTQEVVINTAPLRAFGQEQWNAAVYRDYRGTQVIGAWKLSKHGWAVVEEVDVAEILAPLNKVMVMLVLILIGILAVASVVAIYISGTIAKPIHAIAVAANRIAEGNLSQNNRVEITSQDEVGQLANAFNVMLDNMRNLIGKVKLASDELAEKARGINISSNEVAASNTEQANIAQEVTSAINELSKATEAIANNASGVREAGDTAVKNARESGESVRASIGSMEEIKQAVHQLGKSSKRIGEILNVIDDIADQTNLLALNAAIEAARAGEHGKSFTVVAEAVRSLAEKASSSTKEIADLVNITQEQITVAVQTTEVGSTRASTAINALDSIVAYIESIVSQIAEISAAGEQQAASAQEVTASMESLSAASEEVSASSQEMAGSAKILAKMGEEMRNLVSLFNNI